MSWTVATYTVIHVAPYDGLPVPYGVVFLTHGQERAVVPAVGDLGWLTIGAEASIVDGFAIAGAER
jgi:hypothetical protein